eukprot:6577071-Prymnesium_polylepis.1
MPGRGVPSAVSNSFISMMSVGEDYLSTSYQLRQSEAALQRPPSMQERLYQALIEHTTGGGGAADYREVAAHLCRQVRREREIEREERGEGEGAVSYTHLTLPTICSV